MTAGAHGRRWRAPVAHLLLALVLTFFGLTDASPSGAAHKVAPSASDEVKRVLALLALPTGDRLLGPGPDVA